MSKKDKKDLEDTIPRLEQDTILAVFETLKGLENAVEEESTVITEEKVGDVSKIVTRIRRERAARSGR